MSDVLGDETASAEKDRSLSALYARFVAILLLLAGLARGCLILGIGAVPDFTDMSMAWRAAAVTLLSLDLFAAVGLWIGATWGPVIWAVALVVEVAMYTVFADIFGAYPLRVLFHCLLFAAFIAFSMIDWRRSLTN